MRGSRGILRNVKACSSSKIGQNWGLPGQKSTKATPTHLRLSICSGTGSYISNPRDICVKAAPTTTMWMCLLVKESRSRYMRSSTKMTITKPGRKQRLNIIGSNPTYNLWGKNLPRLLEISETGKLAMELGRAREQRCVSRTLTQVQGINNHGIIPFRNIILFTEVFLFPAQKGNFGSPCILKSNEPAT